MKRAQLDPIEAPMELWHKRDGSIDLTDDVDESEDIGDGDKAEPKKEKVAIRVCGDED